MLTRVRLWLRSVVLRRRLEREMQEEMAEHLARATERLMARGLSAEEARREATREFGNVAYLQEEARFARGTRWLDAVVADGRFALRQFARRPGTTLTMFLVLTAGMSVSSLLFWYVHAFAVQPPPGIPYNADLVRIRGSESAGAYGRGNRTFSEEEFREYEGLTRQFSAVGAWTGAPAVVDAGTDAAVRGVEARAIFVTERYFDVLGVRPVLGPGFPAGEDGAATAPVAVLGHGTWERYFGSDPGVIGSAVRVNGVMVTIVGVMPERFAGLLGFGSFQLWMPLATKRLVLSGDAGGLRAAARLRPGITTQEATAAVQTVASRFAATDEDLRATEPSSDVVPLLSANGDPMFERDVRLMSFAVGLLGLVVLLITCTNVSALLTGLAVARRQEIAVRLSLGAARGRLIRQLLTESALLATAAGAMALGLVWLVLRSADVLIPSLPLEPRIDWPVTLFTFGIALAVGVAFGLSPALHATRLALATTLRDSSAGIVASRARLQRGLVVAQVAFTQPLIVLLAAVLVFVLGQ